MIAIVDYGMGNLRSVQKALQHLGHAAAITYDPAEIESSDRVIVPGVGAFGAAMENLLRSEPGVAPLAEAVVNTARAERPVLGICLGMQLFLTESDELGLHRGLNLLPGRVTRVCPSAWYHALSQHVYRPWLLCRMGRLHPKLEAGARGGLRPPLAHLCSAQLPDLIVGGT